MDMLSIMAAVRLMNGKVPLLASAAQAATEAAENAQETADRLEDLALGLSVVDGKLNITYEQ